MSDPGGSPAARIHSLMLYLGRYRFDHVSEATLQRDLGDSLRRIGASVSGFEVLPEHKLSVGRSRIDFYLPTLRIGIEAKGHGSGGSIAHVVEQLGRYAEAPEIDGLLLVSGSPRIGKAIPNTLGGKPIALLLTRPSYA